MPTALLQALIEPLAFPGVLLASLLCAALLQPSLGDDGAMVTTGLASAALIHALERAHPYERRWNASHGAHEVRTDAAHLAMLVATDDVVRGLLMLWAARHAALLGRWGVPASAWEGVPLAAQVAAASVVAELGGWALHAALHVRRWPLWQLHRVHHAVERLYVLNTYRFHPLDLALQLLCSHPLLHAAGLGRAPVLFWFTVLINSVGQLSHCNVATRCGALSYVFNTPCAHRVHHARQAARANSNYGQMLLVFDVLFGTHIMPAHPGGAATAASPQPRIGDKFLSNAGVWANLWQPIGEMYRQYVWWG